MDVLGQVKEGQQGLQEQVYDLRARITEVVTLQRSQHGENVKRLEDLEHTLHGNGQPGVVVSLTKVQTTLRLIFWAVAAVAIPAITTAALMIAEFMTRKP